MKRMIIVSLILCTALLCCGCVQDAPVEDEHGDAPLSQMFYAGNGNTSESVEMDAGLYRFAMTAKGSGPFVFEVGNHDAYDLLAHGEGPYTGTQVFGIYEKGTYALNVTADDAWTVDVQQVAVETGESLPFTVTGSGDDVAGWIDLPRGEVVFDLTNDGKSFFAACLYNQTGHPVFDPTGTYLQPVHGQMGAYNGSVPVVITEKGPYYLNIVSDGNWSVSVS